VQRVVRGVARVVQSREIGEGEFVLALPRCQGRAGDEDDGVGRGEDEFRYSFGNAISEAESDDLYERWSIPSPGRPLFEAATANFSLHSPDKVQTRNEDRGPLLLVMGGQDHTVPEAITKSTLKQYRHSDAVTDLEKFPDRGHSLTIDGGWASVAEASLAWLSKQGQ
jgi:pimeloyl-ACP methyl ester carboxylesterase